MASLCFPSAKLMSLSRPEGIAEPASPSLPRIPRPLLTLSSIVELFTNTGRLDLLSIRLTSSCYSTYGVDRHECRLFVECGEKDPGTRARADEILSNPNPGL